MLRYRLETVKLINFKNNIKLLMLLQIIKSDSGDIERSGTGLWTKG